MYDILVLLENNADEIILDYYIVGISGSKVNIIFLT